MRAETEGRRMRTSKVDIVTAELKRRIQTGALSPGQRLIEAQLIDELGISRNLLREAFRALSEARLVEIRHNYGCTVRRLTREDVVNIYQTREPLEGMAARLCAERATPEQRRALQKLTEALDRAIENADVKLFIRLNSEFHALIFEAARNGELTELVGRLSMPLMRYQFLALIDANRIRQSQKDHQDIVSAILRQDADTAENRMRIHIRNGLDLILGEIDGLAPSERPSS